MIKIYRPVRSDRAYAAGRRIDRIIFHWWGDPKHPGRAEPWSLKHVDSTFENPGAVTSAHCAIHDDVVHQYLSYADVAYHAGNIEWNRSSVGFELHPDFSEATYRTAAMLAAEVCILHRFEPKRTGPKSSWTIFGHSEVQHPKTPSLTVATRCPGLTENGWDPEKQILYIQQAMVEMRIRKAS